MKSLRSRKVGKRIPPGGGSLQKIELEVALGGLAAAGEQPLADTVRQAAAAVGADLLFVLPLSPGNGQTAVVRLGEEPGSSIFQVRATETGLTVSEEHDIDSDVLGFARATIDVLERLRDDGRVLAPLASAH